jgi:hypothetical protein
MTVMDKTKYYLKRQGGIEPHISDLQSKCKTFYYMSLFFASAVT